MNALQYIKAIVISISCLLLFLIYNKDARQNKHTNSGQFEIQAVQGFGVFIINKSSGQIKRIIRRGNSYYVSSVESDPWEIKEVVNASEDLILKDDPSKKKEDIFDQVAKEQEAKGKKQLPTADEFFGTDSKKQ